MSEPTWYSDWLPLLASVVAVVISGFTAWHSSLRKGTVKATHPTHVFFGPDGPSRKGPPKVYLRFLLYATAPKGRVLESMYLKLKGPEVTQVFPKWIFGSQLLERGSGLFVGQNGVALNHHFLLASDDHVFQFHKGKYQLEFVGKLVGENADIPLGKIELDLPENCARALREPGTGAHFDWGGENKSYECTIETLPIRRDIETV